MPTKEQVTEHPSFAELRKRNRDASYDALRAARPDLLLRAVQIADVHGENMGLNQRANLEASIVGLLREVVGA